MKDKLKKLSSTVADSAGKGLKSATGLVTDIAQHDDTRAVVSWTRQTVATVADEALELGRRAARSEVAKDAATGAAIGAVAAVPIPLVGPMVGAVVGAGAGIWLGGRSGNARAGSAQAPSGEAPSVPSVADLAASLRDLQQLRQEGLLTNEEFEREKAKLLR